MKIAIFQNFLDTIGGAEVVGLTMARELKADIYTTNINREKIRQMGFDDVNIISIGRVPKNAPYRQQMVLYRFRKLNLKDKYDFFIINGDWAVSSAVNNKPNLWYVNATIREIWDLREYVRNNLVTAYRRPIFDIWTIYNRYLNKKYVSHIGKIAANSSFTMDRVKKYLNRDSELIYPPTQTKKFHFGKVGNYWLSVNRIIEYKRVDMQMKAFSLLPDEKLIVLGPYEQSKTSLSFVEKVKKLKPENVTLLDGANSFEELADYYANCKGFITTCLKEDFGMTAIEAMASGKLVIAPNQGGYKETVIDDKTGVLIDDIDENKLAESIKKLSTELNNKEKQDLYKNNCMEQAKKFDVDIFIKKIQTLIKQVSI
jgi:glycosyltransferase involved in cell wall biosynthesis